MEHFSESGSAVTEDGALGVDVVFRVEEGP